MAELKISHQSLEMAGSFLRRAYKKLSEARNHLENENAPEGISSSQEAIELSIKSFFLISARAS